jgi:hypothetical protein
MIHECLREVLLAALRRFARFVCARAAWHVELDGAAQPAVHPTNLSVPLTAGFTLDLISRPGPVRVHTQISGEGGKVSLVKSSEEGPDTAPVSSTTTTTGARLLNQHSGASRCCFQVALDIIDGEIGFSPPLTELIAAAPLAVGGLLSQLDRFPQLENLVTLFQTA